MEKVHEQGIQQCLMLQLTVQNLYPAACPMPQPPHIGLDIGFVGFTGTTTTCFDNVASSLRRAVNHPPTLNFGQQNLKQKQILKQHFGRQPHTRKLNETNGLKST